VGEVGGRGWRVAREPRAPLRQGAAGQQPPSKGAQEQGSPRSPSDRPTPLLEATATRPPWLTNSVGRIVCTGLRLMSEYGVWIKGCVLHAGKG
jgi:hypothetical protein